ncbi:hypothetical protein KPL71_027891 [Citrus sinensis]|uniref:Uncharacterized protein n=1 Tax=Citrus sinensis TaxID=2711 RepID=A0ACB8IAS6_CITSI|nr:hypothetical protein KPL71_027891 [Citrus sinensis]
MAGEVSALSQLVDSVESMKVDEKSKQQNAAAADDASDNSSVQITCFSDIVNDVTLHFQIIRLRNQQIYAWIGCDSAKLGRVYAAATTRPHNTVSVTSIIGGVSDNTGSGIARRIVLKTGLNVILACNIPKDSLMLEANAEKKLVEKLIGLGYTRPKAS